jgi:hypothetical protein
MGNCLLVGSKRDKKGKHPLRILHYIEYLRYHLEEMRVGVWADFFVKNVSHAPARICGLHMGNIRFECQTDGWFDDQDWTPLLLEVGREEIGLIRTNGDELVLGEIGGHTEHVELVCGPVGPWGPEPPLNRHYVCFTAWESPPIEPGTSGLFRIAGVIEGQTYNRLMPDPGSTEPIRIMGGVPLQEEIRSNLTSGYDTYYKTFERDYLDTPAFYHVLFERTGGQSLRTTKVSSDMTKVWVNERVGASRFINWYWSDTDFNVYCQANGPLLEMFAWDETSTEESG